MRNAARATSSCFMASLIANTRQADLKVGLYGRMLLDAVDLRVPFQAELGGRCHVPGERGRGDDGRAGEIAFPSNTHSVLPVPVERRNRAFAVRKRVGSLTETGTAPRGADLAADRPEHCGNRFAAEPLVRPLDLLPHPSRSRKDDEGARRLPYALLAGMVNHERGLQQIVVAAVG